MSDLVAALRQAECDVIQQRSRARAAYRDANQAWKMARAPDATLRMMVAEALQNMQRLADDNARLRAELDELIALVGA